MLLMIDFNKSTRSLFFKTESGFKDYSSIYFAHILLKQLFLSFDFGTEFIQIVQIIRNIPVHYQHSDYTLNQDKALIPGE